MRYIQLIILLLVIVSCNQTVDSDFAVPDWTVGDYRYYKTNVKSFCLVNSDTIYDLNTEKIYKVSVVSKLRDSYVVELQSESKPMLDFKTQIDSFDNGITQFIDLMNAFPILSIPFQVKISNTGEEIELLNSEVLLESFTNKISSIADSLKIQPSEYQNLKNLLSNDMSFEEEMKATLTKEAMDIFDFYGTQIPKTSAISEQVQIPNPQSGILVNTSINYQTLSVTDGIYKIEAIVALDESFFENPEDYLANHFSENNEKRRNPKMDNSTIYYWDSNTAWIDSSIFHMEFVTDTIEIRMQTKRTAYK